MYVHKVAVSAAIAEEGRGRPVSHGVIENPPEALLNLLKNGETGQGVVTFVTRLGHVAKRFISS